jgi:hypothetical protein
MLSMGDEVRRSRRGNNNAYCQDNEISRFDSTLLARHRDIHPGGGPLPGRSRASSDSIAIKGSPFGLLTSPRELAVRA